MLSITEKNARGDGKTVNTAAIQNAIDSCHRAGGGVVLVPRGCFVSGPLTLRGNVRLHLEPGAVLRAVSDISSWPVIPDPYSGKKGERDVYQPFIYAENVSNIGIGGAGVIDGSGEVWWAGERDNTLEYRRPRLIAPSGCSRVSIEGLKLINSQQWTVNPVCCNDVSIHGLTINNPEDSPNTDGINPDSCKNVRIFDCHIDVGDDCIAVKSGTEDSIRPAELAACENLAISDCVMAHGHGAVVCGSEMSGDIRNLTISNCIFKGTERGLRFKSRRGRGGIIENIRAYGIVMDSVQTPFVANLFYKCGLKDAPRVTDLSPHPVGADTPRIERLRFSHITARNAQFAAGVFNGLPEMPLRDIALQDVDIHFDMDAPPGETCAALTVPRMSRRAFFCRYTDNLSLRSVRVERHAGPFIDRNFCGSLKAEQCDF